LTASSAAEKSENGCSFEDVPEDENSNGTCLIKIGLAVGWEREFEFYKRMDTQQQSQSACQCAPSSGTTMPTFPCSQCELCFISRNKLFTHIKKTHAQPLESSGSADAVSQVHAHDNIYFAESKFCSFVGGKFSTVPSNISILLHEVIFSMHALNSKHTAPQQSTSFIEFPISWILANKKVKRLLHQYIRDLSLEVLPPTHRHEYGSSDWWSRASLELLRLLARCDRSRGQVVAPGSVVPVFELFPGPRFDLTTHEAFIQLLATQKDVPVPLDACPEPSFATGLPLRDTVVRLTRVSDKAGGGPGPGICTETLRDLLLRRGKALVPSKAGGRITLHRLLTDVEVRKHCLAHAEVPLTAERIVLECPQFKMVGTGAKRGETLQFLPCRGDCPRGDPDNTAASEEEVGPTTGIYGGRSIAACTIYRDSSVLVLDKPVGVSMEALVQQVQLVQGQGDTGAEEGYVIETVSRLDQQTSGAVVVPLTRRACSFYTSEYRDRAVQKCYICVVTGAVGTGAGHCGEVVAKLKHVEKDVLKTVVHPNGKRAHTRYMCLHVYTAPGPPVGADEGGASRPMRYYSVVLCQPLTGRTHQIRVHMAHLGHPLLGDYKYDHRQLRDKARFRKQQLVAGDAGKLDIGEAWAPVLAPRVCLHSFRVSIRRLVESERASCSGDELAVVSHSTHPAVPADMTHVMERLGEVGFLEKGQLLAAIERLNRWAEEQEERTQN